MRKTIEMTSMELRSTEKPLSENSEEFVLKEKKETEIRMLLADFARELTEAEKQRNRH